MRDFELIFSQRLKPQAQDVFLWPWCTGQEEGLCPFLCQHLLLVTVMFSLGGPAFFPLLKKNPSPALHTSVLSQILSTTYLNGWLLCDADPPQWFHAVRNEVKDVSRILPLGARRIWRTMRYTSQIQFF